MDCKGKNAWPELVGTNGKLAVETIERENGLVKAIVVLDGSDVTGDFRCDRVRVWVDSYDIVVRPPVIGSSPDSLAIDPPLITTIKKQDMDYFQDNRVVRGKKKWPELVGTKGKRAAETIERENGRVEARVVKVGSIVTADVRCDRVRVWVWVDPCDNVVCTPTIS